MRCLMIYDMFCFDELQAVGAMRAQTCSLPGIVGNDPREQMVLELSGLREVEMRLRDGAGRD